MRVLTLCLLLFCSTASAQSISYFSASGINYDFYDRNTYTTGLNLAGSAVIILTKAAPVTGGIDIDGDGTDDIEFHGIDDNGDGFVDRPYDTIGEAYLDEDSLQYGADIFIVGHRHSGQTPPDPTSEALDDICGWSSPRVWAKSEIYQAVPVPPGIADFFDADGNGYVKGNLLDAATKTFDVAGH